MSRGTPANIKLDSRRSASKQLTRQGEMIFFVISFLGRYSFTKNLPRDEDPVFHLKNLPCIYYKCANNENTLSNYNYTFLI